MRLARRALVQWTNKRKTRAHFHLLPIDDLREHQESEQCWCQPQVQVFRKTGLVRQARLITHNALDGRELVELHGLQ